MSPKLKINIFDIVLGVLGLASLYGFWTTESSLFLKWSVIGLFVLSLWQVYKKDNSPVLFVVGFMASVVLFRFVGEEVIPLHLAPVLLAVVALFLFAYRHLRNEHAHASTILFSVYNSLLAVLTAELFYVLTFFPIEARNKGILIVLFLWVYDEIIESHEENRLTRKFAIIIGAIFMIIFLTLALTFPFQPGL